MHDVKNIVERKKKAQLQTFKELGWSLDISNLLQDDEINLAI